MESKRNTSVLELCLDLADSLEIDPKMDSDDRELIRGLISDSQKLAEARRELEHVMEFIVPLCQSKMKSRDDSVERLDRLLREGKMGTEEFKMAQEWNTEITMDLSALRSALGYKSWRELFGG